MIRAKQDTSLTLQIINVTFVPKDTILIKEQAEMIFQLLVLLVLMVNGQVKEEQHPVPIIVPVDTIVKEELKQYAQRDTIALLEVLTLYHVQRVLIRINKDKVLV